MANVYYKIINKNIRMKYTESIINGLQRELYASSKVLNEDIFDISKGINTNRSGLDVDCLLKYYVINQLLKNIPEGPNKTPEIKKRYLKTANKNYRKDQLNNEYYSWSDDDSKWILEKDIVKVNDDGSYLKDERKNNSLYTCRTAYSADDRLLYIQLISPDNKVVSNQMHVVELLDLRKEYALKYKYSGYSGNSHDLVATVLNKFAAPTETGNYMDRYYNLFKWNRANKYFEKIDDEQYSPLLTDYDFGQSRKVIKKEYTGIK